MRETRVVASALATVVATAGAMLIGVAPAGAAGVVDLVSADAGGAPMHKSRFVSVSDDGRHAVFIGQGDGTRSLHLRDRMARSTSTIFPEGADNPSISGDGSVVVFRAGVDVWAYDRVSGATTRVNVSPGGSNAAAGSQTTVGGVSDNGRFVSFRYRDSSFGVDGIWLRDRVAQTTEQVGQLMMMLSPSGWIPGPVSDDGTAVAFSAEVFMQAHGRRTYQSFVWRNGTTTIASVRADGVAGNGNSFTSDMTPDGRYVTFDTSVPLVQTDPNTGPDVYVRDLVASTTSLANPTMPDDDPAAGENRRGQLSDDGSKVAYLTTALVFGRTQDVHGNRTPDVLVVDRNTGAVEVVSTATDGTPASDVTDDIIDMSGDGRYVAFSSHALDIVAPFPTDACRETSSDDGQVTTNYTECYNAYVVDRAATGGSVTSAGGTVSSGSTATTANLAVATVQVPAGTSGGAVTISPTSGQAVPDGYEILGTQLQIEAPAATWDNPLQLTFVVDSSLGVAPADIAIIRDGVPAADCIGADNALPPDASSPSGHPCVKSRTTNGEGDAVIVVLTPHASVWAAAEVPPPTIPTVTFASLCENTQAAASKKGVAQSLCAKLSAASASRDRGDGPSASHQLDAYRNELSAQTGQSFTADKAAALVDQSRQL